MRGRRLADVRRTLKAHLGVVVDEGVGTANDTMYNQLLYSKQSWLATEFNWPSLRDRWDMQVQPGSRFLPLPTVTIDANNGGIDDAREVTLEVKYSADWQSVGYGIGAAEYNALDPDTNQRMDPVQKWQFNGPTGFEIWPLPASLQIIRFTGYRIPDPFITDDDIVDLDDELVALFVAADLLAKAEQQDAGAKATAAQNLLLKLRGAVPTREDGVHLGYKPYKETREGRRKLVPITVAKGN